MRIHVIGGGWVTAAGCGRIGGGTRLQLTPGAPAVPPPAEIYAHPPQRYRRFDGYCRIGCAAIALALRDAGMEDAEAQRPIGIIASTRYGCFETDLAFQATALEDNGIYANPGLFAYTLPGIALAEAAILFRLTGPTFTVGDPAAQRGRRAIQVGADLLASGACRVVLAGWIDADSRRLRHRAEDDDGLRGAVFVVLSAGDTPRTVREITPQGPELILESGERVRSILDVAG